MRDMVQTIGKDEIMQTLQNGYRGLSLLVVLNSDRALYATTLIFALVAGAWLGSL